MAKYLTQDFTYGEVIEKDGIKKTIDGSAFFWARQDEHNHDKSNEFSKAALDWLVANAGWPRAKIRAGKFKSSQSSHDDGKELEWDAKKKAWQKA
jgi:hypothetical protein